MDNAFLNAIKDYNMIKPNCKIYVALSGGADSVVLLYKLKEIQKDYNLTLEALHVNHCIRGAEADDDELFCRELCKKLNVNISIFKIDIPNLAKQNKIGIEQCAREERYKYFYKMLNENKFHRVATAHNLNDNAETILFNLIRGSAIKGLCGIPPIRDKIIRPLINCTKEQILKFANQNKINFVYDKTNSDILYKRNYIRHKILPKALKINPSFLQATQKMSKVLSADEDYLQKQAQKVLNLCKKDKDCLIFKTNNLKSLHDSILSRVIIMAYEIISDKKSLNFINVSLAALAVKENDGNKIINLPNEIILELSYDNTIIRRNNNKAIKSFCYLIKNKHGKVYFKELDITVWYNIENFNQHFEKKDGFVYINYDIINGDMFFRNKKTGDSFIPAGGIGKASVKKMLIDQKIPRGKRDLLPVLCNNDEVIWVYALNRINDKYKPGKNTKQVLSLYVKKGGSF